MTDEIKDEEMGNEKTENEVSDDEILDNVSIDNNEIKNEDSNSEELDDISSHHIKVDTTGDDKNIDETESDIDNETMELYNEFNSFIQNKTDIQESSGTKIVIPTGLDLVDAVLGGGFVVGCLNIIVGQPGGGKTTLVAQTIGNGQKLYNGKILSSFLDAEESMTSKRLANLGIRKPKLKPYSDITIEKVFKYLEGTCLFKEEKKLKDVPSIIAWDSIANTLSEKERETEDINSVIGFKARMLSLLIPKYVAKCAEYNICLLAVNQLRDKLQMGMFTPSPDLKFMSSSKDMPGGQTLKFNAFQLVSVDVKSAIDTSKPDCKYPFDGYISKIKCIKNKLFPPNVEVEAVADFYKGFSNFWTNYNFLAKQKRLKTGAWNYLIDDPDQKKFRTKDAENLYKEDPNFKEVFDRVVKETIQTEIIDKYDS